MANQDNISLNEILQRLRGKACEDLGRMTGLSSDDCRETYLFDDDRFCGVRWTLGNAKAVWRTGSEDLAYEHNGQAAAPDANVLEQGFRRAA